MSIDVMKQALEVLESVVAAHGYNSGTPINAITTLRAAIEQAQEPVAWMNPSWIDPDTRGWASDSFESIQIEGWIPLYTAPRQWQGLTGEEVAELTLEHVGYPVRLTGAIEAKLRERNT